MVAENDNSTGALIEGLQLVHPDVPLIPLGPYSFSFPNRLYINTSRALYLAADLFEGGGGSKRFHTLPLRLRNLAEMVKFDDLTELKKLFGNYSNEKCFLRKFIFYRYLSNHPKISRIARTSSFLFSIQMEFAIRSEIKRSNS